MYAVEEQEVILGLLLLLSSAFLWRLTWLALLITLAVDFVVVADLEHAGADWYLPAHDDAFSDALYVILLALYSRVVKMIGSHLETSQHQD